MTRWRYEFDAYGGYDCMTAAFDIYDPTGRHLITIDIAPFLESAPRLPDDTIEASAQRYAIKHVRHPEAEALAKRIVDLLNSPEETP
jgi:ribosomal protein L16 Arg81 hydroxylase